MARGAYETLDGSWVAAAAASTNGNLFVVSRGALYWISDKSGAWAWGQLDGSWDTITMAGVGATLLLWERSNTIYKFQTVANAWEEVTGTYGTPTCSTFLDHRTFVLESNLLYAFDPATNQYAVYANTWDATQIVGLGDSIYLFDRGGALYRMPTAGGGRDYTQLHGSWPDTMAATAHAGRIYAVNDHALYDIDPETGAWQLIDGSWTTTHLVSCRGHLYSFEADGTLYKIEV